MTDLPPFSVALLLKPEEAADRLGIARTRIFALIKSGELPSVKIGTSRRIRYSDLAAWVASLPSLPAGQAGEPS